MSNTVRKIIAAFGGLLLVAGIICCVYTKQNDLIGTVVIFGLVYAIYMITLSKHLKKTADTEKKSPLRKR